MPLPAPQPTRASPAGPSTQLSTPTYCVDTASTVSTCSSSSSSRPQTMRKLPVPSAGSGRTGTPRSEPQPSRSTSNGFKATATAGYSHVLLCWSIAREIASRFLASDEVLISLRIHDRLLLRGSCAVAAEFLHRVLDRLREALAQPDLRLPPEQV